MALFAQTWLFAFYNIYKDTSRSAFSVEPFPRSGSRM